MTINTKYQIIKYSPSYKSGIIDLLTNMWFEYDPKCRYDLFRWRYEDNPYEKPIIYLAVDKDSVIGFRSFISQKFIKRNKEYLVFSPADTIIHRDYRRNGIISALNDKCIDELINTYQNKSILLINTSTSKPSMPVYLKQNWQKTNGLRRFHFKFSFLNFLQNKFSSKTFSAPVKLNQRNYTIEITPEIKTEILSTFNSKIRHPERLTNIRDSDFFSWRYSFQPEKFTFVYCYLENELQGYLIIKEKSNYKSSLDQFEAISSQVFYLMIKAAFKTIKIIQLRSYAFLPEEKKYLRRSGFFAEPVYLLKKLGHLRFPVLVRPVVTKPEDKDFVIDGSDIREIKNWHLQLSDRH